MHLVSEDLSTQKLARSLHAHTVVVVLNRLMTLWKVLRYMVVNPSTLLEGVTDDAFLALRRSPLSALRL